MNKKRKQQIDSLENVIRYIQEYCLLDVGGDNLMNLYALRDELRRINYVESQPK